MGENQVPGDAALILAAYRRWGAGCLERLDGDFAFVLLLLNLMTGALTGVVTAATELVAGMIGGDWSAAGRLPKTAFQSFARAIA